MPGAIVNKTLQCAVGIFSSGSETTMGRLKADFHHKLTCCSTFLLLSPDLSGLSYRGRMRQTKSSDWLTSTLSEHLKVAYICNVAFNVWSTTWENERFSHSY